MIDQTIIKLTKERLSNIFSTTLSETLVFLHNFCDHLFKIGFNLIEQAKKIIHRYVGTWYNVHTYVHTSEKHKKFNTKKLSHKKFAEELNLES